MKTKILNRILLIVSAFLATACGGAGRVLVIKSEPADADICIKGKARSNHFSNQKACVGSTPFEADRVEVKDHNGDVRTVKFKDVEGDKETFYVIVSRQGYATQAVEVPGWEHLVTLRPEGQVVVQSLAPAAAAAAPAAPPAEANVGEVRFTSTPVGALVYINDVLKGNTPFVYKGTPGQVKLKLELEGYLPVEKVLTVEGGQTIQLNFPMVANSELKAEAQKTAPAETKPVQAKPAPPVAPAPTH